VQGVAANGQSVHGFEMHMGRTTGPDTERAFARLEDGRPDGARDVTGRIAGTYLHGLFAADDFRHAYVHQIDNRVSTTIRWNDHVELALDRLADHLEAHLDTVQLLNIARENGRE
jgi:adenosylcobyric acid synthase